MLFAAMATHHGSDSAEVRLASGISPTGAQVFIEEESCSDDEVEHVAEVVAFLALERGPHKIRAMTHEAAAGSYGASDPRTCDNEPPSNAMCCQDMLDRTCQECWSRQRQPPATGQSCSDRAQTTFNEMNTICCPKKGCTDGTFPSSCDADCAGLWMPIWESCGGMIEQMFASTPQMASTIGAFSDACEATYFGSGGGRCDDDYWRAGLQLITQKCPSPGVNQVYQAGHLSGNFPETCEPACKALFEPFYAECEDRIAAEPYQDNADNRRAYANFLAVCQAAPGGGGH